MTMTKKYALIVCSMLAIACSGGGEPGTNAIASLKADLDSVREMGDVQPVDGITTAGQPNADQLTVFAQQGYAAVIDLRTSAEDRGFDEPVVVRELGMDYVSLPITGNDITFENAKELDRLIRNYDQPVLVHCASANRVGALLALNEFQTSGDATTALEKGRAGGLSTLESKVREIIGAN